MRRGRTEKAADDWRAAVTQHLVGALREFTVQGGKALQLAGALLHLTVAAWARGRAPAPAKVLAVAPQRAIERLCLSRRLWLQRMLRPQAEQVAGACMVRSRQTAILYRR